MCACNPSVCVCFKLFLTAGFQSLASSPYLPEKRVPIRWWSRLSAVWVGLWTRVVRTEVSTDSPPTSTSLISTSFVSLLPLFQLRLLHLNLSNAGKMNFSPLARRAGDLHFQMWCSFHKISWERVDESAAGGRKYHKAHFIQDSELRKLRSSRTFSELVLVTLVVSRLLLRRSAPLGCECAF